MTTNTAPAPSAFDRLQAVHPHHCARIAFAFAAAEVGTVHTLTRRAGAGSLGSFFTGIQEGDRVVVSTKWATGSRSVLPAKDASEQGAHLCTNSSHLLTVASLDDVTEVEVRAGARAADKEAEAQMFRARELRAKGNTDAALEALDRSEELYQLSFALGVFADYIRDPRR